MRHPHERLALTRLFKNMSWAFRLIFWFHSILRCRTKEHKAKFIQCSISLSTIPNLSQLIHAPKYLKSLTDMVLSDSLFYSNDIFLLIEILLGLTMGLIDFLMLSLESDVSKLLSPSFTTLANEVTCQWRDILLRYQAIGQSIGRSWFVVTYFFLS